MHEPLGSHNDLLIIQNTHTHTQLLLFFFGLRPGPDRKFFIMKLFDLG